MGPVGEGVARIFLEGVEAECVLGAYAGERGRARRVRVDVGLDVAYGGGDRLGETLNYEGVRAVVVAVAMGGRFHLVEALAEAVAGRCLRFERVRRVGVRVEKPGALAHVGAVGVVVVREKGGGGGG